jgi:hypothetical protein
MVSAGHGGTPSEGICYACGQPATSREHVPPKCLFPEPKDVGGRNYRGDLITVPSCNVHNSAKSRDDEFLMVSLATMFGGNAVGFRHSAGKVDRALRRSAHRFLLKVITKPERIFRVETAPGQFIDILWGMPDIDRLKRCFESIARGLLFHETGEVFEGRVHVHLSFLFHKAGNSKVMNDFLRERLALEVDDKPRSGSNPEVFYYQRSEPDEFGLFSFRLRFFGSLEVMLGIWPRHANPPPNLVQHLINDGMKTVLTLGDKSFEFN